jgi:tetratricopeptide (TPR) repeat protein
MKTVSLAVLVALTLGRLACAQIRSPQPSAPARPNIGDGNVTLQVQVLTEGHAVLDGQALIRLRNIQDMDERWDTTHLGSQASLSGLARGSYTLEVSAVGFLTSVVNVDLRAPQQVIQIVLKQDVKRTVYAPPDTTGISRKAREQSERGILALQAGNLNEAEKFLRKALKAAPQHAHVNYLLGIILLQEKRLPEAQKYLEQATVLDPLHAQALTTLGGLRLEQKDYAPAAQLLQRAIAVNARQWRTHWLLANVYLAQQEFEPARTEAELAVNLSNQSAPYAMLALGEALGGLGRYSEALTAFKSFLQELPSGPDAPAVERMIAAAEARVNTEIPQPQPAALIAPALPLRTSPLLSAISPTWGPADVDSASPPVASGAACPGPRVLAGVGKSVKELVDDLERFSALRTQVHEQLDLLGHPLYRQSRRSNYLAALAQPQPGWLELSEYSRDMSGLGPFTDGIRTRGMLGLALIFHPTLQSTYEMNCEGLGEWKGEPAWLVHFRQRPDRPPRLQSFKVGGQEYAVALKGRAWISASLFRIVHIEADLLAPIAELELRSEHQIADYGPVDFKKKNTQLWLPKDSQTYLDYRGRHYRFSDHFDDFVLFSVESRQEIKAPKDTE